MEKNKENKFTKVYQRASKSPFDDHGTILWLACYTGTDNGGMQLTYERYLYLHRTSKGEICGISISKQIHSENPEFSDRYLSGYQMYKFLLLHIEEICEFCETVFREEFISVFLIPPIDYFSIAEDYWLQYVSENDSDV